MALKFQTSVVCSNGVDWYAAEFAEGRRNEIYEARDWCISMFGPRGEWYDLTRRWWIKDYSMVFRNKEDLTLFLLRWS